MIGTAAKKLPRAERREQLLATAKAILGEEGTDALTLGYLAERAGVSKPIAYEHFGTRAGLLIAICGAYDDRQKEAQREALEATMREALEAAEAGIFPLDRVPLFTENHRKSGGKSSLSDYYQAAYGRVSFDKSLRRNVVFSDHSLVTDAVFGEMHLISCRNVLIYFDRELQDHAIGLFKGSLTRKGFLGLGAKENLRFSKYAGAFCDFVREEKIYQRRAE